MDNSKKCCICDGDLSEKEVTNVCRGLETLIDVSKKRKDGKSKFFEDVESIVVHTDCRRKYTSICRGKFTYPNLTKAETSNEDSSLLDIPKRKSLRKSPFDFQNNCFICGLEANIEKYKKKNLFKKKNPIFLVKNEAFVDSLMKKIEIRNDQLGNEILQRICTENLVSKEARYHQYCKNKLFLNYEPKGENKRDKIINEYMTKVYQIIDDSQDCKFILKEIMDSIGEQEYIPCIDTVKKRLMSNYDNLTIISKDQGQNILCFGDPEYMALQKLWKEKGKDIGKKQEKMVKETAALLRHLILIDDLVNESSSFKFNPEFFGQFLNKADSSVPDLVNLFFSELCKFQKGDKNGLNIQDLESMQ